MPGRMRDFSSFCTSHCSNFSCRPYGRAWESVPSPKTALGLTLVNSIRSGIGGLLHCTPTLHLISGIEAYRSKPLAHAALSILFESQLIFMKTYLMKQCDYYIVNITIALFLSDLVFINCNCTMHHTPSTTHHASHTMQHTP